MERPCASAWACRASIRAVAVGLVERKTMTSGMVSNQTKKTVPTGRQRAMIKKAFARDRDCAVDFLIRDCVSQSKGSSVSYRVPRLNGCSMRILTAEFIRSCAEPEQFLNSELPEIAFIGRSN